MRALAAVVAATILAPMWPAEQAAGVASSVLLAFHRAETAVAVDPRDPRTIVVAANPTYRFNAHGQEPMGIFVTHDGGQRWAALDAPMVPPYVVGSDPSVAFGPDGTLYAGFEAVAGGFCGSASNTAVLVTRSTDGGRSFQPPVIVDANPDNDKPYLAVGLAPDGQGDAVYVSWIRFASGSAAQIAFARSLDGGRRFSAPRLLSSGAGLHLAPMPAAGARGQVAVAWLAYTGTIGALVDQHIEVRSSTDGGDQFGALGSTTSFLGLPGIEQPGSLRLFNGPSLAFGSHGRLYLAWPQQVGAGVSHIDIMLGRSTDGGQHWSGPIALNDDAAGDRFEPQIAVAADGSVVAAFYDRRRDGVNLDIELAVAHDTGTGLWRRPNLRLTAQASPIAAIPFIPPGSPCLAQGRFFGDYLGLAQRAGQAAIAWTASEAAYPRQTQIRYRQVDLQPDARGGVFQRW